METLIYVLAAVGGAGAVVFGLARFLGRVWEARIQRVEQRLLDAAAERERQDYARLERLEHRLHEMVAERERQEFGVRRVQVDQFARNQYEVYLKLWAELQALKQAIDALWDSVTEPNLIQLSEGLRRAERQIDAWCLFIEPDHLVRIRAALQTIGSYNAGKFRLAEIRDSNAYKASTHLLEEQLSRNHHHKHEFERALDDLRQSFQRRLSSLTPDANE